MKMVNSASAPSSRKTNPGPQESATKSLKPEHKNVIVLNDRKAEMEAAKQSVPSVEEMIERVEGQRNGNGFQMFRGEIGSEEHHEFYDNLKQAMLKIDGKITTEELRAGSKGTLVTRTTEYLDGAQEEDHYWRSSVNGTLHEFRATEEEALSL